MAKMMKFLVTTRDWLVPIGAAHVGLVEFADFNVATWLGGLAGQAWIPPTVYALVGISGGWLLLEKMGILKMLGKVIK